MDEFNREACEMDRAANRYPRISTIRKSEIPPRWRLVGNRYQRVDHARQSEDPPRWRKVGVLLLAILLIWAARANWDDLAEHFKPAQPVAVKQEAAPDITGQIRSLERMIAEAKQLNVEINAVHDSIKKDLATQAR